MSLLQATDNRTGKERGADYRSRIPSGLWCPAVCPAPLEVEGETWDRFCRQGPAGTSSGCRELYPEAGTWQALCGRRTGQAGTGLILKPFLFDIISTKMSHLYSIATHARFVSNLPACDIGAEQGTIRFRRGWFFVTFNLRGLTLLFSQPSAAALLTHAPCPGVELPCSSLDVAISTSPTA